jgi:glutathione S-transferase
MTLYDWPRSGHAHRIRLFLSILGVPYESVNVDLMKGEHKDPEYRKLSPLGQVPTLVDGDTVITDSTAAGPVLSRAGRQFGRPVDLERADGECHRLFKWMQQELADRTWLAADHATIADIAMYTYIRVVDEGDIDLAPYPAIVRWLEDVEKLEGFEPMPRAE